MGILFVHCKLVCCINFCNTYRYVPIFQMGEIGKLCVKYFSTQIQFDTQWTLNLQSCLHKAIGLTTTLLPNVF